MNVGSSKNYGSSSKLKSESKETLDKQNAEVNTDTILINDEKPTWRKDGT